MKDIDRIKSIMSAEWHLDVNRIHDDFKLGQVPEWDSMGHVALLLKLQNEFEFVITPRHVQELTSIRKITDYVSGLKLQME